MNTKFAFLILSILVLYFNTAYTAKILGLVPFPCKSHAILGSVLLKELAKRGHYVTMLSSFPLSQPVPNYKDIYVDITNTSKAHKDTIVSPSSFPLLKAYSALECCTRVSDAFLEDQNVRKLLSSGEKFDVVISMGKEALLGVSYAVNASTIRFNMLGMHSIYAAVTMNPLPSSYVSNFMMPFSDHMTFLQRVTNTLVNLFFDVYIQFFWLKKENKIVQKHFPGIPHLQDLQKQVDITFVNSHMAIENVRPHMPNVIQIGGFHLHEEEKIEDKELQHFLDTSYQGVIFFSMGSSIQAEDLNEKLNEILECFQELKQKVLWKHDGNVEGQPNNVKTFKWLPQKAVLAHPNMKLFITHGGLGSVLEAVYYAVPMIVLPIYLDQHKNAAQAARDGYAVQLEVEALTADKLRRAIRDVTTNPAYAEEIGVRSAAIRQQEVDPMERAVFWVERVVRQRSANYLKCVAKDMPMYQYYLLDVAAFILFCCVFVIGTLLLVVKKLWSFCRWVVKRKMKEKHA